MDNEDKKNLLAILGVPVMMIGIVLLATPFALLTAWAVQKLYGWFVLPLGAPQLNLWHVWGLMLMVNLIKPARSNDNNTTKTLIHLAATIFTALLAVLLGYLIKGHI